MKKAVIVTVIVLCVLVVVGGGISVIKSKKKKFDKGPNVRIENPQKEQLIEFVSAPGQIEPKKHVEISAKISARIIELPFDEGDTVTAGDLRAEPPVSASVLVRLDDKDLQSQLRSVRANKAAQEARLEVEKANLASQRAALEGLKATLDQAQKDMVRQKSLLESNDISQSVYDRTHSTYEEQKADHESRRHALRAAELNLIVLEHNIEAAEAQIEQALEAIDYTVIRAPIDGVITRLNAEVGEMVMTGTMNNPGTVIMEVADLSRMLVVAEVDEADVGNLRVGQKATVTVQAFADQKFEGVVDTIALSHRFSNTGAKYYRTEILLDTNDFQLYSGLTAHVDIETLHHDDVLTVPSQAVLGRPVDDLPVKIRDACPEVQKDKTYTPVVYRFIDDKSVVTPVKIGPSNLTHTVIHSGLSADDRVVTGPYKVLESLGHDKKIQDERAEKLDPNDVNDINDVNTPDTNPSADKEDNDTAGD